MQPVKILGATDSLGKPRDWDEATQGPCGELWVQLVVDPDTGPELRSAWKPSADELATLNRGGLVRLSIVGAGHPPCMIEVIEQAEEDEGEFERASGLEVFEQCECGEPILAGQLVFNSVDGGLLHADCVDPENLDSFQDPETGLPPAVAPQPFVYRP